MRAYSMDLRVRVLSDCDSGAGTQAVAEKQVARSKLDITEMSQPHDRWCTPLATLKCVF